MVDLFLKGPFFVCVCVLTSHQRNIRKKKQLGRMEMLTLVQMKANWN